MHLKNILRRLVGRQSPPSTDGHGHPGGLETGQLLSRLLPYQHEESGSYLEQDWARFDSALNRELCAALLEIYAAGKPANDRNRHEASLLHIGCGAGSLFRAVDHFTAHSIRWRFVGTDPDWRALGYVQARFPDAKLIAADDLGVEQRALAGGLKVDVCVVDAKLYALSPDAARARINLIAQVAGTVVIAHQIDNAGGVVEYDYNGAGQMTDLWDQNKSHTQWSYTTEGQLETGNTLRSVKVLIYFMKSRSSSLHLSRVKSCAWES